MAEESRKNQASPNKLNCWEVTMCGRQPGGEKAEQAGVCPAAADMSFDGINSGKCGGRICWAVAGTFCGGCTQGSFAEKRASCLDMYITHLVNKGAGTITVDKL